MTNKQIESINIDRNLITNDIQKDFTKFSDELKVKDATNNINEIADALTEYGDEILEGIKKNMINGFSKIDGTEKTDPQLSIYENANKAFENDINAFVMPDTKKNPEAKISKKTEKLNTLVKDIKNIIQLKKLEKNTGTFDVGGLGILAAFVQNNKFNEGTKKILQTLITQKITDINTENKKVETEKKNGEIAGFAINQNYETQEEVKNSFFETNKQAFDATMNTIYNASTTIDETNRNIKDIKGETNKTKIEEQRLINLIKLYTKGKTDANEITDIKIGKGKDFSDGRFNQSNERLIQYKDGNEVKYIPRGNDKDQKTIAADEYIPTKINEDGTSTFDVDAQFKNVDRTSTQNGINAFDDKGSYVSFDRFIKGKDKQEPGYLKNNFNVIIGQILTYEPLPSTDRDDHGHDVVVTDKEGKKTTTYENDGVLKNGYANMLTDYILETSKTDVALMTTYIKYLNTDKQNILGADETTRIENFNKLLASDIFQAEVKKLPAEQQKAILDLRADIAKEKPISVMEIIIKLMSMFGFGKGKMKKMFPGMADKINEMYGKQFAMEEDERNLVGTLTSELSVEKFKRYDETTKDVYTPPKGSVIKDKFTAETKTKLIKKIMEDEKNYKWIDPVVVKRGIQTYNEKNKKDKTNKPEIKESDFIIKKELKMTGIKANPNGFQEILTTIAEDKETRNIIAKANNKIRGLTEGQDKTQYSQYFDNPENRRGYIIDSEKDIGTFLTSYLFAGSKDLSYLVTENDFSNGSEKTPTIVKPKQEPLAFNTEDVDAATGTVTAKGATKMIHEVFATSYETTSKDLLFTLKGETTAKKITQGKATIGGKEINTYVYTDSKPVKRVIINEGDKITLPEDSKTNETKEVNKDYAVYDIKDNSKFEFTKTKATTMTEGSFLVNGPQVDGEGEIVGGYVKDGKSVKDFIDPASLSQNRRGYFSDNNGIFGLGTDGKLHLTTYAEQQTNKTAFERAFQNGPILVQDGKKTKKFNFGANLKATRSGIGFTQEGKAMVIYSNKAVTMDEFAKIFVGKGCTNAIYLDGGNTYSGIADKNGITGALQGDAMKLQFTA